MKTIIIIHMHIVNVPSSSCENMDNPQNPDSESDQAACECPCTTCDCSEAVCECTDEVECTDCPETECTECPETECTDCPEAECTECPEAEFCESNTNDTTAEQANDTTPSVHASEEGQQSRTDSCTAIGGGLGALAVVLVLTLVGVVLGWVWHCHRNNRKFNFQER